MCIVILPTICLYTHFCFLLKGQGAVSTEVETQLHLHQPNKLGIIKKNMSRALSVLALSAAVKVALAGTLETCSSSSPLSCSSDSTEASCCYESPGGLLLQTQFWDYSPSIGPSDSWGIHGLWYVHPLQHHTIRHSID